MGPWFRQPMAFYDSETTGVNVETDRVVSACHGLVLPSDTAPWAVDPHQWLVDPGIPIPPGATRIHGITDARVRADGQPPDHAIAQIAQALAKDMANAAPVIGMNLAYDLTLLDRECRRHLGGSLEDCLGGPPRPIVDLFVLDKAIDPFRKGHRKLIDLAREYSVPLDPTAAHDAAVDALTAARICYRLANRCRHAEQFRGWSSRADRAVIAQIGVSTAQELHDLQVGWRREQQNSLAQYFRSRRRHADADGVDPYWPVKPYNGTLGLTSSARSPANPRQAHPDPAPTPPNTTPPDKPARPPTKPAPTTRPTP